MALMRYTLLVLAALQQVQCRSVGSRSAAESDVIHAVRATSDHWVDTWTSMPQQVEPDNLPPAPFGGKTNAAIFQDATLRQTFHVSIGADRIRLQISNIFGGSDLPITEATIALPVRGRVGVNDIDTHTLQSLTFGGNKSVTIPRGQAIYTDALNFTVAPQSIVSVSLYFAKGQSGVVITGHPGSRTTSWMESGNHVSSKTAGTASTKHWYFVTAIEASVANASAFVILGDSITDGRGSTDDSNNRWPDLVLAKMQKAGLTNIGVNNEAAGGNAILTGGLGPPLLTRYKRDSIQQQGVKYVMIFEGVNDIGVAATDSGTQTRIGDGLISAYKQIAADCKAAGLKVFGATITPFSGSGQAYSDPAREKTRQRVNQWILTSGTFDAVVDFAKVVSNPSAPSQLAAQYDGGDHLHPNVAGYQALADAFPLSLFA